MTQLDVNKILHILITIYGKKFNSEGYQMWKKYLNMIKATEEETEQAVDEYVIDNRWPPTIADIVAIIRKNRGGF